MLFALMLSYLCVFSSVWAGDSSCALSGTPAVSNGNLGNINIIDPAQNAPGVIFDSAANWNTGSVSELTCGCDSDFPGSSQESPYSKSPQPAGLFWRFYRLAKTAPVCSRVGCHHKAISLLRTGSR